MSIHTLADSAGRNRPRAWRDVPWFLAVALVLSLHVWFPRIDVEPLNDTYSAELGGRNAFYQLIARRSLSVERNLEPLYRAADRFDGDSTLILLGPVRYPTDREWQAILDWVADGGSLLFAARWDDARVAIPSIDVTINAVGEVSEKMDSDVARTGGAAIETDLVKPQQIRWESRGIIVPGVTTPAEPLIKDHHGLQVVRLQHGAGTIVVCASDQIFSNSALFDRKYENGVLAARLLEAAGTARPVIFDESLNATGTPQVVGLLLDPHLRPLTVQWLVVLVLFGWRGGRRFGGLIPVAAAPRHNLTDHTDALGNLYYKSRNGAAALRGYLEPLKRELRLPADPRGWPRALAPIAQRTGIAVEEIHRMLSEAERKAQDPSTHRTAAGAMIRSLSNLRRR